MRALLKLLLAVSFLVPNFASAQSALAPTTTLEKGVIAGFLARKATYCLR
jgi:hypothetical protein